MRYEVALFEDYDFRQNRSSGGMSSDMAQRLAKKYVGELPPDLRGRVRILGKKYDKVEQCEDQASCEVLRLERDWEETGVDFKFDNKVLPHRPGQQHDKIQEQPYTCDLATQSRDICDGLGKSAFRRSLTQHDKTHGRGAP